MPQITHFENILFCSGGNLYVRFQQQSTTKLFKIKEKAYFGVIFGQREFSSQTV